MLDIPFRDIDPCSQREGDYGDDDAVEEDVLCENRDQSMCVYFYCFYCFVAGAREKIENAQ